MIYPLWQDNIPYYNEDYNQTPGLHAFPVEGASTCVLICPGGGYSQVCMSYEGYDVAEYYNSQGISAFVLEYRIRPYQYPTQLEDVLRAVRVVRSLAKTYGYHENKIAILGFSAGGHLASMAVTHFDEGKPDGDEIDKISSRPDLGIFCYPVLTMGEYTDPGTRSNLLGDRRDDPETRAFLSSEIAIKDNTPPCFFAHTVNDTTVPVQNSMMMASAMISKGIPVELHVFPYGRHGFGMGRYEGTAHAGQWTDLSTRYIKDYLA